MGEKGKKTGIWIRVSTHMQAEGDSPEHHEMRARMYAETKGWEVVEVYNLAGYSGKSVLSHPEAVRMLEDIKSGHITGLIFSGLARLARNTKELLDISDYFREHNADLISLKESIDTSSPAGRLFFTLIAAMATWEREEIAARVKASIPVRAKMGKSIGGAAPYGYKWENKQLVIDENEAPIRKLIYDLFLKHKRKKTVARKMNERGHRTKKGAMFSSATITRLLEDPIAKGLRRMNYTESLGVGKSWKKKPEEEWIFQKVPAIVSEEIWDEVQAILKEQGLKNKPRKRGVHLFSGIIRCHCGEKMYMLSNSPKYTCKACRNKIPADDIEDIYHLKLRSFLLSESEIENQLSHTDQIISQKEKEINILQSEAQKLQEKLDELITLVQSGELPRKGFRNHYQPVYDQHEEITASIPRLEGELAALQQNRISSDVVIDEAAKLLDHWKDAPIEEKRRIVEEITTAIIIGDNEIEIHLHALPHTPPSTPFLNGLQKGNAAMSLRIS